MYLHFMPLVHIDMTKVLKILPQVRPGPTYSIQSMSWLLMCEGILCSSVSVKELDVIVHEKYFPCITPLNFGHSVPHLTSKPGG